MYKMNANIINCIKLLNIKNNDKDKWNKYYHLETKKYYDYFLKLIPKNQNILEIGSGGGVFYEENVEKLIKLNNNYTCIDIDKNSIEKCKSNDSNKYVNFLHKDIHSYKGKELGKFDILFLIQSYVQIPKIHKVFGKYFKHNPNGCIMMINTIYPPILVIPTEFIKNVFLPKIFNYDCVISESLTLKKIKLLENTLSKKIINIKIENSVSGMDEYLTIIHPCLKGLRTFCSHN
jgi:2-polyprenyl-3-methyl-5-hydroxy-6-metoxy-1,4-benzoquinol methylase